MQKKPWWRRFFFVSIRDDVVVAGWGRGLVCREGRHIHTHTHTHTHTHSAQTHTVQIRAQTSFSYQEVKLRRCHWEVKWRRKEFSWTERLSLRSVDTATVRTVLKTTVSKYCTPLKPLKGQFPLKINMYSSAPHLPAEGNSGEVSSSTKHFWRWWKWRRKGRRRK